MKFIHSSAVISLSITLLSSSILANEPTTIGCKKKSTPAFLSIEAVTVTSVDQANPLIPTCPLLDKKKLRKFINKFAPGTIFAHPFIPFSCVSGIIKPGGTIKTYDGETIEIDPISSYSESAQRLFPVPNDQEIPTLNNINIVASSEDTSLLLGAAMTVIHLKGEDSVGKYHVFDLLLDDHFNVTQAGEDSEDLRIVGSKGKYKFSGRLIGKGQIVNQVPLTIEFKISGTVCMKPRKKLARYNPRII